MLDDEMARPEVAIVCWSGGLLTIVSKSNRFNRFLYFIRWKYFIIPWKEEIYKIINF
jgi:hypothetical protein